ncbi:MAG: hypothetical protein LBE76_00775 [Nitrososphaerota archaeon]|jgi:hypothetical protein|nr:hypothetical protein [Nitrososphaerota archaeon]
MGHHKQHHKKKSHNQKSKHNNQTTQTTHKKTQHKQKENTGKKILNTISKSLKTTITETKNTIIEMNEDRIRNKIKKEQQQKIDNKTFHNAYIKEKAKLAAQKEHEERKRRKNHW